MFTYRSKITLGLKIHLPKPANRTRSIRHSHWLATTAVLAIAFAAAMFVYSIGPATNDREVRAQDGNAASTDVTVIPRPPVETPYDADRTAPSPNDGRRTIVAPPYPDYPTGSVTGVGSVALDWDDVPTALSYAVQVHTGTAWTLLPWNDVTIQFSGTSAQIDNLPNYDTYYLRLRAENSAGNSPWSGFAVIVNDATGQATSTPVPTATQAPVATATQEPAPTATQAPVATSTPTVTSMATATPTQDPSIIDPPPGSCNDYLTAPSGSSGRSPEECSYPKLGVGLESRVCRYDTSLGETGSRGANSQFDPLTVERIQVYVLLTEDLYLADIMEWISERESNSSNYNAYRHDVNGRWLVVWYAPIPLLGELSRRSDVRAVELVPQPRREAQSSANSGWTPTVAPFVHGAEPWLALTPAVDGDGVKVGIIDFGFDGIQELLRSKGITAIPTVNCVFDDGPGDDDFFCEPGLHGESREAHGAHVAEALLSIAPNVDLYLARIGKGRTVRSTTEWLMAVLEAPVGIPELEEPVDVINASLGYDFDSGTAGVPDNDASVLASIATAVAGGAVWVNSAGNRAQWKNVFHVDVPNAPNEYSSQWDNDWLQMDDGIDFVPVELEQSNADVKFRLRWGAEDRDDPPRLHLFACDNNGCASHIIIGEDLASGTTVKRAEWLSSVGAKTFAYVRVCRDPNGGYPSWVQIGASPHTKFETVSDKYRTINGIAESRSTALLAVGAASAAMNSSDVSYTLEPFSSLGPTAAGITKPDVVGVDRHPSTILATQEVATQVAEGTPISSASSDVRWPGTS